MLQADSEANFARWIAALQQGIGAALQLSSNSSDSRELSAAGGGVNASVNEEDSSNNNRKTKYVHFTI